MERRDFIVKTCRTCLAITSLGALLESCGTAVYFAKTQVAENRLIVPKGEFVYQQNGKDKPRNFVFINTPGFNAPVCLFKTGEHYTANLMYCTHKGCELEVQGSQFVCPCHGSIFNLQGDVTTGPADKPLQSFKTTIDHENIYIWLTA